MLKFSFRDAKNWSAEQKRVKDKKPREYLEYVGMNILKGLGSGCKFA